MDITDFREKVIWVCRSCGAIFQDTRHNDYRQFGECPVCKHKDVRIGWYERQIMLFY